MNGLFDKLSCLTIPELLYVDHLSFRNLAHAYQTCSLNEFNMCPDSFQEYVRTFCIQHAASHKACTCVAKSTII